MALPLLALAGTALWGGAQWLANREDDKRADTFLERGQGELADATPSFMAKYGPAFEGKLRDLEQGDGFFASGRALEGQSFLDDLRVAQVKHEEDLIAADIASGEASRKAALDQQKLIRTDVKDSENKYRAIAGTVQRMGPRLADGSMSGLEVYDATLGMLKSMFPDEAIMEGDLTAAINAGGLTARLANKLIDFDMGGTMPEGWVNDVRSILGGLYNQSRNDYEVMREWGTERATAHGVRPEDVLMPYNPQGMPQEWQATEPVAPPVSPPDANQYKPEGEEPAPPGFRYNERGQLEEIATGAIFTNRPPQVNRPAGSVRGPTGGRRGPQR